MKRLSMAIPALRCFGFGLVLLMGMALPVGAQDSVSFYHQVLPIFKKSCNGCHHPGKREGGLDLTTFQGLQAGGESGAVLVLGKPNESALIEEISGASPSMPKKGDPLTPAEVELIHRWIASGGQDDTPADASDFRVPQPPVYVQPPLITAMKVSPDGHWLAISGYHEVWLHPLSGNQVPVRLLGRSPRIESMAFSRDSTILVVAGGAPSKYGEIQIWDLKEVREKASYKISTDSLMGVSLSPDETKIGFGGADKSVRIIDLATGAEVVKFDNHSDWVLKTTWSQDGQYLISGSRDRAMKLIRASNGQFIDDINQLFESVISLARHPSKDIVAYGGDLGTARIYRISDNQNRGGGDTKRDANIIATLERQAGVIYDLEFSPDGSQLCLVGQNGLAKVFGAEKGDFLFELKDSKGTLFAVAYHPTKPWILTGGFEGKVRVYNSSNGELLDQFDPVPLEPASASTRD